MKTCSKCNETKPLDEFYAGKNACKRCTIARVQARNEGRKQEKAAYDAARYARDPKPTRDRVQQWRRENPHAGWESYYRQRAAQYGFTPLVESFTREELVQTYGDACVDCGGTWDELEHVVPVVAGGAHNLQNCRPICRSDNRKRWAQYKKSR